MSKRVKLEMAMAQLSCEKYQYASEKEAKKHLKEINRVASVNNNKKKPVRAYKCNICPFWHLTSKQ